jgi:hypothetical protein
MKECKDNLRSRKSRSGWDQSPLRRTAQLRIMLEGDGIMGTMNEGNERLILPGICARRKIFKM